VTPDCMSAEELRLWRDSSTDEARATVPCIDCPVWFSVEMRSQGCCNGVPKPMGRPVWRVSPERAAQLRLAARRYRARRSQVVAGNRRRRAQMRADIEALRIARSRAKDYNDRVGVSDNLDSVTMRTARSQVLTPPAAASSFSPGVRR
jgi:hypothetical protein